MKMLFFLLFAVITCHLQSQQTFVREKRDYIWQFGWSSSLESPHIGGTKISFLTDGEILVEPAHREMSLDYTNAGICDTEGNLLLYTNGIYVVNSEGDTVENGYGLNPDPLTDAWYYSGYYLPQGAVILPAPGGGDSLFYIFHTMMSVCPGVPNSGGYATKSFFYTIVDSGYNDGQGKVIEKNVPIIQDTIAGGAVTATRHANGRDWWLIISEFFTNRYYRLLLTPDGVQQLPIQTIGEPTVSGLDKAVFSPDGRLFARLSGWRFDRDSYLDIFDFDRCSGELSNFRRKPYYNLGASNGLAFSENSRFLYISAGIHVYQTDLTAESLEASWDTIAIGDGFLSPTTNYHVVFDMSQLAPNGKIYITPPASVEYLGYINHPNLPGKASQVVQHGIQLPTLIYYGIPNHPYYGLGPEDGSACDTLGIDNPPPVAGFEYLTDSLLHAAFYHDARFSPVDWYWTFGDGATSTAVFPKHTYAAPGEYEVCLTVSNLSGSDTYCDTISLMITGTAGPEENPGVRLYPNPARESIVIEIEGRAAFRGTIVLCDALGRRVLQQAIHSSRQSILISALPPGLYFYELREERRRVAGGKLVRL